MIMIAFNNFNLLASFPRKLLRLFRQGITTKQRISAPFWMYGPWTPPGNPKPRRASSKDVPRSNLNGRRFTPSRKEVRRGLIIGAFKIPWGLERCAWDFFYSSISTDVPSATRSKSSMTSALRIRTQPQLSGWPILSSCFVP